jgi:hypothetical protein
MTDNYLVITHLLLPIIFIQHTKEFNDVRILYRMKTGPSESTFVKSMNQPHIRIESIRDSVRLRGNQKEDAELTGLLFRQSITRGSWVALYGKLA